MGIYGIVDAMSILPGRMIVRSRAHWCADIDVR